VVGFCQKKDLNSRLLDEITKHLEPKSRVFYDMGHTLNREEMLGILGRSDRKGILIVEDSKTTKGKGIFIPGQGFMSVEEKIVSRKERLNKLMRDQNKNEGVWVEISF